MRRTMAVFVAVLVLAAGVWVLRSRGPADRAAGNVSTTATDTALTEPTAGPSHRTPSDHILYYAITSGGGDRWPVPATTEIYAYDVAVDTSRPVFSDARLRIVLQVPQRAGVPEIRLVATGNRLFAPAFVRGAQPSGSRLDPSRFYELSTDGSNRARELFTIRGDQSLPRNVFVSPEGDRLGYINDIQAAWFVFIHDTQTGALLDSIPLRPILLDGFVRNIGWMPDGKRLFLTGETGDIHVTSEESERRVGTYLMNVDGTDVHALPSSVDSATTRPGFYSEADTPPTMLGAMPDGRYLFGELQWGRQPPRVAMFYQLVDSETGQHTDITPERAAASGGAFLWSKLSPDGQYLAFSEIDPDQPRELLRILDIRSGKTRTVLTRPAVPSGYPVLSIIGW